MAFTMAACKRVSGRPIVCAAMLLAALSAQADFKVSEMSPRIVDQFLSLSGKLDLGLTAKVQEALSKGIPIEVIIHIDLFRRRFLLWDPRLHGWVLRRRISYHALSRQYLVSGHRRDPDAIESFTSLEAALASMGFLDDLKFHLDREVQDQGQYYLRVRATLDVDSLPAPLRPVAYTSLSWRLSSGWTVWTVQH
ncbi:MAG: DUF4390 domain-containing protein [Acidiferrobacterales bacterium]|nr:DUF4390 domain-containing protein [Acidiferrobacterales bacterium]